MSDIKNQLIEYLKNEYIRLSDRKEAFLEDKIKIQVQTEREDMPLFDMKKAKIAQALFSPFFKMMETSFDDSKEEEKNNELELIDKSVNDIQINMDFLKESISYLQNSDVEQEEDDEMPTEDIMDDSESRMLSFETNHFSDMLLSTYEFLKNQYEDVEFFINPLDASIILDSNLTHNLIRVLTYYISSTLETRNIDTVIMEVFEEGNYIKVSSQMIWNDEMVDQFDYQFLKKINQKGI